MLVLGLLTRATQMQTKVQHKWCSNANASTVIYACALEHPASQHGARSEVVFYFRSCSGSLAATKAAITETKTNKTKTFVGPRNLSTKKTSGRLP